MDFSRRRPTLSFLFLFLVFFSLSGQSRWFFPRAATTLEIAPSPERRREADARRERRTERREAEALRFSPRSKAVSTGHPRPPNLPPASPDRSPSPSPTSYLIPPGLSTKHTKKNAARLHIAWQPLVVNEYFLGLEGDIHPDVSRLIRGLCTVAGLGLSARLAVPGNPVMALGSYLNRAAAALPLAAAANASSAAAPLSFVPFGPSHPGFAFPELPPAASAAGGAHCGFEALCGARLCTFQGVRHLAWSVPLLPATYLLPSGFVHAMLFFGPAVFAPGSKIVIRRILSIGAFAIGPLFSMVFSATGATSSDGAATAALFPEALGFPAGNGYANTWPAWWCFMSAAQALLILIGDVLARDGEQGLTERERVEAARRAAAREAAAAAAAGKGGAPPSSSRGRGRPPMNLTASASATVEHEYEVAVPAPAAAARGGSTRRRAAAN